MAVLDHLVYAVPELDAAIDWFDAATGVRPALGGSHEGMGTWNALVSFGDAYLELIAPDPNQPDRPASGLPRPFGIDTVLAPGGAGPSLVGFAVRPDGTETIDELADRLADAGQDPGQVVDMSRVTPDGDRLSWRLTLPTRSVVPFLIDWGDTVLPSATQPGGVDLDEFAIVHPRPFDLLGVVAALGLDVPVTAAEPDVLQPALSASLTGPSGELRL